jgi:DNA ligase-associated metallophosphoesterase
MNGLAVQVAGEELLLRGDRLALWPKTATLIVADPHFGKPAAFRAHGVYVPEGSTEAALQRLDDAIVTMHPERILFLGDFLHAKEARDPRMLATLNKWRARHSAIAMTLVRGNHDAVAGDPPRELDITCVNAPLLEPPFAFAHRPTPVRTHYVLCGHVHPAVVLSGPGRQRARLACFWFRGEIGILPAFGEFTGVEIVEPAVDDRVFVVADEEVLLASLSPR